MGKDGARFHTEIVCANELSQLLRQCFQKFLSSEAQTIGDVHPSDLPRHRSRR